MNDTARLHLLPPGASAARRSAPWAPDRGPAVEVHLPVRLTRRGRVAILLALLAALVLAGFAFGSVPSRASGAAGPAPQFRYVVVQPGETLWEIARESAPDVDPRVMIARIQEVNALAGARIFPGQRLALP